MLTRDIHSNKETVATALYELDNSIKMARKDKDKLLCLIVGYGSKGGSHKIKTAVLEKLDELVSKNQVKAYIMGSDLDLFNSKYLNFKYRERIPEACKRECNPGKVYIVL